MAKSAALATYLEGIDDASTGIVRELDAAVRAAGTDLDVAVKYKLLMYALKGDWRHWVCAIDAHPRKAVGLRFLYGVLLDDPQGVLRGGTSVLKTWDIPRDERVDASGVRAYVAEAIRRYPEFRANEQEILASSREAATKKPGGGSGESRG